MFYTYIVRSYFGLSSEYEHDVINHAETYVNGQIHTNVLENFWALLKRGLGARTSPSSRSILSVTLMHKLIDITIGRMPMAAR